MNKYTSLLLPALVALGVLATPSAEAATILASFDLNRSSPLMSGDPTSDTDGLQLTGKTGDWVDVTAAALTPDGTDSSSGTNTVTLDFIQVVAGIQSFNRSSVNDDLRQDCFYLTAANSLFTIELGGLNAFTDYQVVFYGQLDPGPKNPSDIWFGTGAGTGVALDSEYDANFASVTTDINGDLLFTWQVPADSTGVAAISGIQVAAIPEPSAATLLGLASLALILRRRK
jgi:hypothetical protein